MTFQKTSFMHRDIGEHEHEVTIYDSYEIYAVCNKCGMHDWSVPKTRGEPSGCEMIEHLKTKYPKNSVLTHEQMEKDYEEWGKSLKEEDAA